MSLLAWGARSLKGHVVLSLLFISLPILALGIFTNLRAGYLTADLPLLIGASVLAALPPAFGIWYWVTAPRLRRGIARDL
jgi:hypothetical protein